MSGEGGRLNDDEEGRSSGADRSGQAAHINPRIQAQSHSSGGGSSGSIRIALLLVAAMPILTKHAFTKSSAW
jgi:hypothetical protein